LPSWLRWDIRTARTRSRGFSAPPTAENLEKVLYKDENTGGIDVAFRSAQSDILFAALWQARRTFVSMASGGPGDGCIAR